MASFLKQRPNPAYKIIHSINMGIVTAGNKKNIHNFLKIDFTPKIKITESRTIIAKAANRFR